MVSSSSLNLFSLSKSLSHPFSHSVGENVGEMDGAAVGSSVLDLGRIRCRRLPVRAVPLSGEAVIIVVERADIKTGMKGFILIMFYYVFVDV